MPEYVSARRPSRLETRFQHCHLQGISRQANAESSLLAQEIASAQARRDERKALVRGRWREYARLAREVSSHAADEDIACLVSLHRRSEAANSWGFKGANLRESMDVCSACLVCVIACIIVYSLQIMYCNVQTRAQRASAAMALAGRAKEHDVAVIVLQKFVRRWLAHRRLRSLRFQMLFSMGRKPQGEEEGMVAGHEPFETDNSDTGRGSTARFRARASSNNCTQDDSSARQPLIAIEMQRKEERRLQLRKANAERKENQPQHPVVARCLTPQQAQKVSRRNYPHSRQHTPAATKGAPNGLFALKKSERLVISDDAMAQTLSQRSGASHVTSGPPQELVQGWSNTMSVKTNSIPDQVWTPGTVCKDDRTWQIVHSLEDEYNRKQQLLSHSRSNHTKQRKPLHLNIEESGPNTSASRESVPKDPADIAYIMTQTQQGSVLENVDSCFRLLTGRYKQFWALPSAHTIDERDWAHRRMLNKVQPKEGELYRPLKGRIIRTGEDVAAVIDELNRALTPSLEEFRARTAPVCAEGYSNHDLNDDNHCDLGALGVGQDPVTPMGTSVGSMDHLQGCFTTTDFQANHTQSHGVSGDGQMENTADLVRVSSRHSWDSEQPRDQDSMPVQNDTDDADICSNGRDPSESLLCARAVLAGDMHDSLQGLGALSSTTSRPAVDSPTHENDEEVISNLSVPSDVSAGEGTCGISSEKFKNARRKTKGRSVQTRYSFRSVQPRFMRELTRAPTYTSRIQMEQQEIYKMTDRELRLAPCTPLNTRAVGTSCGPRLKMTHSKVRAYWSATTRPSALMKSATLDLGRVGLPSDVDAGSLGHLSFAEQSFCDHETFCSLTHTPREWPNTQKSQVRFHAQDSQPLCTNQTGRPRSNSLSGNGILTQLPPASYGITATSAETTSSTVQPITEAEAATERMAAAAALIETRQRALDNFNVQLYQNRKHQHKIGGVDWHTTRQVPGDPWQPHQMHPTRVGIISRSLLPCATRTSQPGMRHPTQAPKPSSSSCSSQKSHRRENPFPENPVSSLTQSSLPLLHSMQRG